jgi:hypothetical protein
MLALAVLRLREGQAAGVFSPPLYTSRRPLSAVGLETPAPTAPRRRGPLYRAWAFPEAKGGHSIGGGGREGPNLGRRIRTPVLARHWRCSASVMPR